MKKIEPWAKGAGVGILLATAILIGTYFSPLRQYLFIKGNPETIRLKREIQVLRDSIQWMELKIQAKAFLQVGGESPESLKAIHVRLVKDYMLVRDAAIRKVETHSEISLRGWTEWMAGLWILIFPVCGILTVVTSMGTYFLGRRKKHIESTPSALERGKPDSPQMVLKQAIQQIADITKKADSQASIRSQTNAVIGRPANKRNGFEVQDRETAKNRDIVKEILANQLETPNTQMDHEPETKELDTGEIRSFLGEMEDFGNQKGPFSQDKERPSGLRHNPLAMDDDDPPSPSRNDFAAHQPLTPPTNGDSAQPHNGLDSAKDEESDFAEFEAETKQKADVLKLARRGYTSSEISRRLRMSQDQVEIIIRLRREKG